MRFLSVFILILAASCASNSKIKKSVEAKIAAQEVSLDEATKPSPIEDNIKNNKMLTDQDKQELLKVVEEVREKNLQNLIERLKIRKVLVQEMTQNYNSEEVKILKKKFLMNNRKRVENMFYVLDRFEEILKEHDEKHNILQHSLQSDMMNSGLNRP
ncbi:MAG: hypothetical protein K2P81_00280 [Bacteriovoracaceae bacterium]|nr:hypothetical protein [Bacteriovoracaceae bacterium]